MRNSIASIGHIHPRHALPIAFALGALILGSARAHADDPEKVDVITVTAPAVKIVGRDSATGAPIEEMTVTVRVQFDPVTLTTNSGVALLKDSVVEAAQKACGASLTEDGTTCVHDAIISAKAQIDAAIAQARSKASI
jgi:UrcA family protein